MDRNECKSTLCIPLVTPPGETTGMDKWQERARARMREIGLSQEKLAEQFGMTPAGIQKWLAGTRQPSFDEINLIADRIGVTRTWLTYGLDPNDTTDGLPASARAVVRKLIRLERAGLLPPGMMDAIGSMIDAVVPHNAEGDEQKSGAPAARNGTTD